MSGQQRQQPRTKIWVVSLERAAERRAQFSEAAAACTVDWEFYAANTGVVAPLTYDEGLTIRQFGRPLSPGELGCYTSHFKLWELFLQSDYDQAIILEDDILVDWLALNRLAGFDFHAGKIDILRLFSTHPFPYSLATLRFMSPHSHLVKNEGLFLGTQGYLVTRAGAEALLTTGNVVTAPVDWVMSRYYEYRVINYCLLPYPILERYAPSHIGSARESGHAVSAADKINRLTYRIRNRLKRAAFNRSVLRNSSIAPHGDAGDAYIDRHGTPQG